MKSSPKITKLNFNIFLPNCSNALPKVSAEAVMCSKDKVSGLQSAKHGREIGSGTKQLLTLANTL
jgi:hypothetical protein